MKISEMMSAPVYTVRPSDSLAHAAQLMWDHDCGAVPVVNDEGRLVAMVTDRDVAMAAFLQGVPIQRATVASAMSRTAAHVREDDTVELAEGVMRHHHVRRVPVLDHEQRVVGMITITDLVRAVRVGMPRYDGLNEQAVVETLADIVAPREPVSQTRNVA